MSTMINRYVAKLIESWVLEVMTLYTGRSGFVAWSAQADQSFSPGVHTQGFLHCQKRTSKTSSEQIVGTRVWPDVRTSIPKPLCWCYHKNPRHIPPWRLPSNVKRGFGPVLLPNLLLYVNMSCDEKNLIIQDTIYN